MGWVPKDEFRGDPNRHVAAQAFVERGENELPLMKAQMKRMKAEMDTLRRDSRKAVAQFTAAQEKAYERAMSDLEARGKDAVEAGDTGAINAIIRDAKALTPPEKANDAHPLKEEAEKAIEDFRDENRWFDRAELQSATDLEKDAKAYYHRMVDKHMAKTDDLMPAEFFAFIGGLVKDRYPDLDKPKTNGSASRLAEVAGQGARRTGRGGKTFDDLPLEGQRMCDKWVKQKLIPSREAYLKTVDWNNL